MQRKVINLLRFVMELSGTMRKDDRILILQEAKFIWSQEEVDRAIALFSNGLRPTQVADLIGEKIIDTSVLYLHLLDKGKIKLGG